MTSLATPQFYTPDDLAALLTADFTAHQIAAVVEVGQWDPELRRGEPRVIIDFGDGEIGEPVANLDGPGAITTVPGGGSTDVARQILDDAQTFVLWIHAPPVGSAEGAAAAGRRATDQLLRQTARAIRRKMAAPFRRPAKVRWPEKGDPEVEGYQGYVRGTLARVDILLPSAIADDALAVATTTQAFITDQVVIDGTPSAGETTLEIVP